MNHQVVLIHIVSRKSIEKNERQEELLKIFRNNVLSNQMCFRSMIKLARHDQPKLITLIRSRRAIEFSRYSESKWFGRRQNEPLAKL